MSKLASLPRRTQQENAAESISKRMKKSLDFCLLSSVRYIFFAVAQSKIQKEENAGSYMGHLSI
jgi:hypothetical protein